jgi:bifunctional ADP-heptose synthase (sugar kinase/adenylyltransferase)
LRATNLAAYEIVDYVIINNEKKPLELLEYLQPDYYSKGYDYSSENRERSLEEAEILRKYGGELIITSGDVVFSSTELINAKPPKIQYHKLADLMHREGITFDKLKKTLDLMQFKKIHVVGDTIVDTLTNCKSIGAQSKTPTISALYENQWRHLGGGGVVAKHCKSAGADVLFTTILGNDELRHFVCEDLENENIKIKAIIDSTRPTTEKNVVNIEGYRLLRISKLDNRTISNGVLDNIKNCIKNTHAEAIIFSDFRHGIFNRRTIPILLDAIPEGVFRAADSQLASRWGNITEFCGFDLITPNEKEARFALADQDSGIRALSSDLYDSVHCKILMMKLGSRGVLTCRSRDHDSPNSYFTIDSFAEEVVDPVGAGDAMLAYATLAMLVSGEVEATILGSIAAACECQVNGNVAVSKEMVLNKLEHIEQQCT